MAIVFEDFAKIELRTGKIVSAAPLEGANKLLKLEVEVGTEKREIIAGIAKDYAPADIVGKTVIVLVNIEPKQLRGATSNGMVLAATNEAGGAVLLTTDKPINTGAKVF